MNCIKTALIVAALAVTSLATAQFKTVSQAYELSFEELQVPNSPNGTITFQSCEECEDIVLRATADTRYVYNGEALSLPDFRQMMYRIRSEALRSDTAVTVLHHLETDTLVSIKVTL